MAKRLLFVFSVMFLTFLLSCEHEKASVTINLDRNWKFITGDNLDYAKPDFDDSAWKEIRVDKTWNKQGYPKYWGFAWYRIRIKIPSSLKEAELKDSLIFKLGKIDDFDQVFFNGVLIGENLKNVKRGTKVTNDFKNLKHSYWNVFRRYSLAIDDTLIKWDKENVIAVRVYDWGVAGGIFSGGLSVGMPQISDYLKLQIDKGNFSDRENSFAKTVRIKNVSRAYTIEGEFEVKVADNITEKEIFEKELDISLPPLKGKEIQFVFPKPTESSTIRYSFEFENESRTVKTEGIPYILTPPVKEKPQINGALVYGERPGKPFLYRIAATGKRPMTFGAKGLPSGLSLNEKTGIIRGRVEKAGKYKVVLTAENKFGSDSKVLEIVIGDKLALTPPMGWNSWNCWGLSVSQEKVYDAAMAFVKWGLADHGWTYVNIDDGWEIYGKAKGRKRSSNGEILTNEKFPDMKKLGDDIHALGLKFGIYSSPGPLTCGGYTASYGHEYQDARTFAKWGIDYLKYDLCSYRKMMKDQNSVEELMPPYIKMHKALQKIDRDIVYSICEYGNGKVWEWGEKVGGNLWRTTGDIWDEWARLYEIGFGQAGLEKYAGPGHWNDPDMLVVGWVGWGPHLHRTYLSPDEQYTHVSLWALLSAPLLLGNDLTKLDDFTLNLITNDEVIAIDQDKLGKQASRVMNVDSVQVWKKDLADGNVAVGIFNVSTENKDFDLDFAKIGLKGKLKLRDVWRQRNIGEYEGNYKLRLPAHGVKLFKIFLNGEKH
jgi:PKD repeat protein